MGYYFVVNKTAWTLFVIVYISVIVADSEDPLINSLGLDLPDLPKINISLDEYERVVTAYLSEKDDSYEPVPELRVYRLNNLPRQDASHSPKMIFPIKMSSETVESALLRLLLPPQNDFPDIIEVEVYQILGVRRRRLLNEATFYLSKRFSKWCEIDITDALSTLSAKNHLGLELVCKECTNNLNPEVAAVTAFVHTVEKRKKRSTGIVGRTDCSLRPTKTKKRRCCRHEMTVSFTKLGHKFLESRVVDPKTYEAGYCRGLCPPNFNFATNHSRIQGIMHQLWKQESVNAKNVNDHNAHQIPKSCCAPSKLGDLQILVVSKIDPSKLEVLTWKNMRVLECACF
ncbi:bone morphogenetic protein 6 [Anthonomus grandis grandis]|uniref:bone morphogenetic protein 6 n=1 Tax=Anthonomus grandis grandis TaxID=2921223 RepID=UPI0021655E28|nr:bone morphogenetic protein 6 [Anthonomus grandis grandis]